MPAKKKEPTPERPIDEAPVPGGVYKDAVGKGYHNAHGEACNAKGKPIEPKPSPVGPSDDELSRAEGDEGDGGGDAGGE